ncbi:ferredoxin [Thermosporothrix hazakensis]|jgi:ferredoxin|uniref:Ferredoxin n=2 Tax=Thermosporothrix TaxID=768650 RepID=A0A326UCP8_THEHA|nr:ferredoxin [Thermosporothrix hazakensis]PZW34389.1 ferredoxin [Thermosporothrix hazakensis]BBH85512.1 hypothetical protein KTC_02630 [Thermosporothrix sp. COM3]GCE46061.1 hypothetical protein KTH_09300 [Thermosporothrix hazakensis]
MRIVVDLNRCQSYGQCVFAASGVFHMHGEEALEFDYAPDDSMRLQVERAAAACPVRAISIERTSEPIPVTKQPRARTQKKDGAS